MHRAKENGHTQTTLFSIQQPFKYAEGCSNEGVGGLKTQQCTSKPPDPRRPDLIPEHPPPFPEPVASSLADRHVKRCSPRDQGGDHPRRDRGRRWRSGTGGGTQSRRQLGGAVETLVQVAWVHWLDRSLPDLPQKLGVNPQPRITHQVQGLRSTRPPASSPRPARQGRREHAQPRACWVLLSRRGGTICRFVKGKRYTIPRGAPSTGNSRFLIRTAVSLYKEPCSACDQRGGKNKSDSSLSKAVM
ncbi:uncharacterized protein LOC124977473 isoform X2 [Sciurus carolinensis]|uniref:uncharacterized protein LOC124977473 isoform X2 n=1 Tax=Sciurus carolinensis TaxID=30640 RepID=UPI001FB25D64|nr:uncharacterized protein LOC124977473 isoform X2 [Sciurus carolinensis]